MLPRPGRIPTFGADHNILIRHLGDDAPIPAGMALWDAIEAGRAALASYGGRRVVLVFTDASDNSSVIDVARLRSQLERQGLLVSESACAVVRACRPPNSARSHAPLAAGTSS